MITGITYNWHVAKDGEDAGEVFTERMVGVTYGGFEVMKIEEHPARGDGDKWFYDIYYSDSTIERVFNPNQVFYKPDKT